MVVTTNAGPKQVSELTAGDSLLVVRSGALNFAKVRSIRHRMARDLELVRLCSSVGDVVVGPEMGLVAASGLVTAAELERRFVTAFSDTKPIELPRLEVVRDSADRRSLLLSGAERVQQLISNAARVSDWPRLIYRIGSPYKADARMFAGVVAPGCKRKLIPGRAGGAWIVVSDRRAVARRSPLSRADMKVCANNLWNRGEKQWDRWLPIEAHLARCIAIHIMASLPVDYDLDYSPRYGPVSVTLRTGQGQSGYAQLQSVRRTTEPASDVVLDQRSYLVIGRLLVA